MNKPRNKVPVKTIPGPPEPDAKDVELPPEILAIHQGLARIVHGDYRLPIDAKTDDPAWKSLTAQINRAIGHVQRAIKQAEDARREAAASRDKALEAARSETHFLTNVSHEIHTPLASIRSAAEILRQYPDEPVDTRIEFLDIILAGAKRLDELVGQVLDLGRIQAGRIRWDFRQTNIATTITDALHAFTAVASRLRIHIDIDLPADLPQISADPERMKQLWTSLIDNAIKFRGTSDRIQVTAHATDEGVEVGVRDFGIGIRAEDQAVIFQRFCQVNHGLTDKPEGVGLGLSIAEEIVASHRGSIEVESGQGQGSLFRVKLPAMGR